MNRCGRVARVEDMRIAVAGGTGTVGALTVRYAEQAGHEVLVLSRSNGVDLVSGQGLDLAGVDAVIDASGPRGKLSSTEFFTAATRHLLDAEAVAGVNHHIALSIVGAAKAPFGYYAGKAAQERLVTESVVPWTMLRTTQFFEFAEHNVKTIGRTIIAPAMLSQPVAAASVADKLVALAEGEAAGLLPDLAGPEVMRIADAARAITRASGEHRRVIEIALPGGFGRAIRNGSILPDQNADIAGPHLEQWLAERRR